MRRSALTKPFQIVACVASLLAASLASAREVPSLREVRADSQGFADQLLSKRNAFVLRNQQRMFAALEAVA